MLKIEEARDALRLSEIHSSVWQARFTSNLQGPEGEIIDLSIRTAVVQAVLGLAMYDPGSEVHAAALELLKPTDHKVTLFNQLIEQVNHRRQRKVEDKVINILLTIQNIRAAEATIPTIVKREVIQGHLQSLEQVVWPDFLLNTKSEELLDTRDLLLRQSKWEIVVLDTDNTSLRYSSVLEKFVYPLTQTTQPTLAEFADFGLNSAGVGIVMSKARNLANKARGIHYERLPEVDLEVKPERQKPGDLSTHPRAVPPRPPSTMDFRPFIPRNLLENSDGRHPAENVND